MDRPRPATAPEPALGPARPGALGAALSPGSLVGVAEFRGWAAGLSHVDRGVSDAGRIDQLRALEELKSAAAAAQARIAVDLDESVRAEHAQAGAPVSDRGKGVAAQVALARRESPHRGGRHLGLARALTYEMPHTAAALAAGVISEWRATLLVRETASLSAEDRRAVDAEVAGDRGRLEQLGDAGLTRAARAAAARRDAHAMAARARRAESERTVTLRPAPDVMTYLTARLPVRQGVAAYAALQAAADSARAEGDSRGRGQVMADALVARVTGREQLAPVPVHVGLVMTDRSLLAGDDEPANVEGYGPIPAPLARALVRRAPEPSDTDTPDAGPDQAPAAVWLRRLFTHPATGQLVAMDSRARLFPPGLRRLLVIRDQTCRTPWCDAPIRHVDHVVASAQGGRTDAANGQGLCEACNYVKEAPGWVARLAADAGSSEHVVEVETPTGHLYRSHAPPLPGRSISPPGQEAWPQGGRGSVRSSPLESALVAVALSEGTWTPASTSVGRMVRTGRQRDRPRPDLGLAGGRHRFDYEAPVHGPAA